MTTPLDKFNIESLLLDTYEGKTIPTIITEICNKLDKKSRMDLLVMSRRVSPNFDWIEARDIKEYCQLFPKDCDTAISKSINPNYVTSSFGKLRRSRRSRRSRRKKSKAKKSRRRRRKRRSRIRVKILKISNS